MTQSQPEYTTIGSIRPQACVPDFCQSYTQESDRLAAHSTGHRQTLHQGPIRN